ncbi:hypothetical protein KR222_007418, partial [Zaprionus bogoriensis]
QAQAQAQGQGQGHWQGQGKDEIKRKFRQATVLVSMQDMLGKLSRQCFRKCVARPEAALRGSEESCIALCVDCYVDSYNLVARAFAKRLQREIQR